MSLSRLIFERLEDALDIEFEVAPPAQEEKPKQMPKTSPAPPPPRGVMFSPEAKPPGMPAFYSSCPRDLDYRPPSSAAKEKGVSPEEKIHVLFLSIPELIIVVCHFSILF